MLNLKRKTKIVLACLALLSLLLLSSWSLLDITTYNLNFDPLKSPKTSSRSEIYTPYKDITKQWDYPDPYTFSHYPRINESSPDGVRIGNYGEKETKEEIFELKCFPDKEEAGTLDSVTVKTYCTCWAGYGGVSVLKVSYQMCLNGEWSDWSNNKIVSSTFSWTWKNLTWGNLGIELDEFTTILLRVKLISYINSRRYGGDVYVDTLKAELEFNDILDLGVNAIDAEEVWGGSEGAADVLPGLNAGEDINVCILDTGIDTDHLDLFGNYKGGYDFYEMDTIPEDANGHGTHCAGIIGALDNDIGVIGVAPKVNLYVCRVGKKNPEPSNVTNAILWAMDQHPTIDNPYGPMDVISMSWGGYLPDDDEKNALNEAFNAGIVLVAASGNYPLLPCDDEDSPPMDEYLYLTKVNYPAAYNFVIAVGALEIPGYVRWTDRYEEDLCGDPLCETVITYYYEAGSCYGSRLNISAPGFEIFSTYLGGDYTSMTGTSMACPMVAGVCALILSASDTIFNLNGSARVRAVWHCLYNSTVQVGGVQYNQNGWHEEYGYGMVYAPAAVNYAVDY